MTTLRNGRRIAGVEGILTGIQDLGLQGGWQIVPFTIEIARPFLIITETNPG